MADLIACLSTGKGTWVEVIKLISLESWDHVYLITNSFGKENFKHDKAELIVINDNAPIKTISDTIYKSLQGRVAFADVAVNFISGTGKEHMALISALLKLGVGIRFVTNEENSMVEL